MAAFYTVMVNECLASAACMSSTQCGPQVGMMHPAKSNATTEFHATAILTSASVPGHECMRTPGWMSKEPYLAPERKEAVPVGDADDWLAVRSIISLAALVPLVLPCTAIPSYEGSL